MKKNVAIVVLVVIVFSQAMFYFRQSNQLELHKIHSKTLMKDLDLSEQRIKNLAEQLSKEFENSTKMQAESLLLQKEVEQLKLGLDECQ